MLMVTKQNIHIKELHKKNTHKKNQTKKPLRMKQSNISSVTPKNNFQFT